jgi:hypothetical protein
MNQIHRAGLVVASVASALVVGGALVVDGYTNGRQAAATSAAEQTATEPTADPTVTIDPLIVYVMPQATPPVITITNPPAAVAPDPTAPVIHVIVPSPTEDEDKDEGHEVEVDD